MLEAEISPTGEVLVAGHHVGELQGFRFTADPSAGGEDAKAVKAAAQKSLAAEFELRATRFSAAPNGDIALGSDGTLRWLGAPVGTLVAGEDALKPRVILLADEQLTGPSRDQVAARAERFVQFQVETFLKPLVDLKGAEGITGIARGIAFQLAEQFGLVNRRDISGDIKSLDGEGRAALRRCGVRFGAYHVFVPTLVKPGPAGLVTLLWALAKDAKERQGFGDVVHSLASGRTSVVVDAGFDPAFYKLAGYRILGRRAVRVDILERLADLIRPALAWKPGAGARPEGAFDGGAFLVTGAMMSILGANAEDIEDILKGLGYRGEPRVASEVKARIAAIDDAAREAAAKAKAEKAAADAALAIEAEAAREAAEAALADVGRKVEAADIAPEADTTSAASALAVFSAEHTAALGDGEASTTEAEAGSSVAPEAVASADTAPDFEALRSQEREASVAPESAGGDWGTADGSAVAPEAVGETEEATSIGSIETTLLEAQAGSSVASDAVALEPTTQAEPQSPEATAGPAEVGRSEPADAAPVSEAGAGMSTDLDQGAVSGGETEPAPKAILLWRPARFEPRPRHRPEFRGRKGAQDEPAARADRGRAPAVVEGVVALVAEGTGPQERDGRRDRQERGKPRFDRSKFRANPSAAPVAVPPAEAEVPIGQPDRRPEGQGDRRPERRDRRPDRRGEPNGGKAQFQPKPDFPAGVAEPSKPREDRTPDPDSPFAKLAALRDLLKK